ncbi:MAG TPA: hypothetical protein VF781_10710 [Solirubrobacteraceae bacterium]
MRRFMAMVCLIVGATTASAAAPALGAGSAPAGQPSPARLRAAVRRAESSSSLWATINICDVRDQGSRDLGIRGQMPALGFPAWLSMNIKLYYFSTSKNQFLPVPTLGTKLVRLGRFSSGLQQGGALFQFAPQPQPTFKATVTFIWRRSGRLLGETTRTTTAGHPNADYARPPHYSAATCKIT